MNDDITCRGVSKIKRKNQKVNTKSFEESINIENRNGNAKCANGPRLP